MLDFTHSSELFFMAQLHRCAGELAVGPVEERACCVRQEGRARRRWSRGEERKEQPGCSMIENLSTVILSNSPQRRTAKGKSEKEEESAEDDEGERIVFSH